MTTDRELSKLDSKQYSKFEPFKNIPAIWTFAFMSKPMWGTLQEIGCDGVLKILGKRDRIVLARSDAVIGVGMV